MLNYDAITKANFKGNGIYIYLFTYSDKEFLSSLSFHIFTFNVNEFEVNFKINFKIEWLLSSKNKLCANTTSNNQELLTKLNNFAYLL